MPPCDTVKSSGHTLQWAWCTLTVDILMQGNFSPYSSQYFWLMKGTILIGRWCQPVSATHIPQHKSFSFFFGGNFSSSAEYFLSEWNSGMKRSQAEEVLPKAEWLAGLAVKKHKFSNYTLSKIIVLTRFLQSFISWAYCDDPASTLWNFLRCCPRLVVDISQPSTEQGVFWNWWKYLFLLTVWHLTLR